MSFVIFFQIGPVFILVGRRDVVMLLIRANTLVLLLFVIELLKPRLHSTSKEHLYSVLCFCFYVQFEVFCVFGVKM